MLELYAKLVVLNVPEIVKIVKTLSVISHFDLFLLPVLLWDREIWCLADNLLPAALTILLARLIGYNVCGCMSIAPINLPLSLSADDDGC